MKLDDLLQQERSRRQALAASERTDKFRELLETNLGCRHAPARRSPAQYLADMPGKVVYGDRTPIHEWLRRRE